MCGSVCLSLVKAHGHCDCCEAIYACASYFSHEQGAVIAARRCMHVWECVFGLVQGAWSL
jgi:hypothetical protein